MDQELGMLDQESIHGCGCVGLFIKLEDIHMKNYRGDKFRKSDFLTILKYEQRLIEI